MMDEQLIDEVAQHGVIYNRQKYYLNGGSGGGAGGVPNGGGGGKYETKDEAWQTVAIKLRTDVETCKKRWKYLRERYVSQRKQGDPPVYEHLSRPYLEKMKFLDSHIQPRKSYRNVPNFLTSPHSANSSNYSEYNIDSKSNGSMKVMNHFGAPQHHYHQQQSDQHATMNALSTAAAAANALETANGHVKIEADQVFRDFAAAVASQHMQQISQSQLQHHQAAAVAAAIADSSQNYPEHYRDSPSAGGVMSSGATMQNGVSGSTNTGGVGAGNAGAVLSSTSSSMKSPLSSPLAGVNGNHNGGSSNSIPQQMAAHSSSVAVAQIPTRAYNEVANDELDSSASSHYHNDMKKPRVQLNAHTTSGNMTHSSNNNHNSSGNAASNSHFMDDTDDSDDNTNSNMLQPQTMLDEHQSNHYGDIAASTSSAAAAMQRSGNSLHNNGQQQQQSMFPANADFLFQLYQQLPHQQQTPTQQQQHFGKFSAPQAQPTPQRSSEHLLGELVTTELLKMSKERRKHVQKRILEILFFDD